MEKFGFGDTKIEYGMKVTYKSGNREFSVENSDCNLTLEREVCYVTPYLMKTRIKIMNISDEDVFIKEAIPVLSSNIFLKTKSSKWQMLIHGRHKNDLPSVCQVNIRDERFMDAVNRLSEEGAIISDDMDDEVTFHSDLLTIIHTEENNIAFFGLFFRNTAYILRHNS